MKGYVKFIWAVLLLLVVGGFSPVTAEVVHDTINQADAELPAYRMREPDVKLIESCREDAAFNYTQTKSEMPEWLQRLIDWIGKHLLGINYSSDASGMPDWGDILLRIGVVAILVFLIYKIVRSKYRISFGQREKYFPAELVQDVPEKVDENSYVMWLDRAISNKDFSLAVRIHYLYVLFLLDRAGVIVWDKRKTNIAYLYEIKDTQMKSVFKELSWVFDCVCYGEFVIGEMAFRQIEDKFKAFQKEIGG